MKPVNLKNLFYTQFEYAKCRFNLSLVTGILILGIDVYMIFSNQFNGLLATIAILLTVLNSLFLFWSDRLRDIAEAWLRKFELHSAIGWAINPRELTNFLADATSKIRKAVELADKGDYFASKENPGVKRILDNLQESAWWTMHESKAMANIVGLFGGIFFLSAFATLFLLFEIKADPASETVARAIITIIAFIFSGGYIRLALDYSYFYRQSERIEAEAFRLGREGQTTDIEAIKLFHEYQIDRSNSPLLPTWLYKMMKKKLNRLWAERASSEN